MLLYRHIWNVNLVKKYKFPLNVRLWRTCIVQLSVFNNHTLWDQLLLGCFAFIGAKLHINLTSRSWCPISTVRTLGPRKMNITKFTQPRALSSAGFKSKIFMSWIFKQIQKSNTMKYSNTFMYLSPNFNNYE